MEMPQRQQGDFTILGLKGKIDTGNYMEFDQQFMALISEERKQFILDMSELEYISSAGLRTLLTVGKAINEIGGKLIYASLTEYTEDTFRIAGFSKVFPIYDSPEEAIKFSK